MSDVSAPRAGQRFQAPGLAGLTLSVCDSASLPCLAARDPAIFAFLLESGAAVLSQSRYDFLLADRGESRVADDFSSASGFWAALDALADAERASGVPGLPFIGGWFVYLGYEMAAAVEPTLRLPDDPRDPFATAFAVHCRAAIVHDRKTGAGHVVCEHGSGFTPDDLAARLMNIKTPSAGEPMLRADRQEADPAAYLSAVGDARHYLQAGHVFQVKLARKGSGRLAEDVAPTAWQWTN